jgi:hypothetical protein
MSHIQIFKAVYMIAHESPATQACRADEALCARRGKFNRLATCKFERVSKAASADMITSKQERNFVQTKANGRWVLSREVAVQAHLNVPLAVARELYA